MFFLCFDFVASFRLVGCIENFDCTWLSLIKGLNRNSYATNKKNIFTYRSDSCPWTSLFTETCPYWREVLQGGGKNTWVEKFPHVQFCVILRKRLNALISDMCEFFLNLKRKLALHKHQKACKLLVLITVNS